MSMNFAYAAALSLAALIPSLAQANTYTFICNSQSGARALLVTQRQTEPNFVASLDGMTLVNADADVTTSYNGQGATYQASGRNGSITITTANGQAYGTLTLLGTSYALNCSY